MKLLFAVLLLATPLPALAQQPPATHEEAQRIVRAEAERWRPSLEEEDGARYPDVIGTVLTRDSPQCQTRYTIRFPAFIHDGRGHAPVVRKVQMLWGSSVRPAAVDGTTVTLTWQIKNGPFEWHVKAETPERARAFAAAADFLIRACAPHVFDGTKTRK
jgi:hypothetical protein